MSILVKYLITDAIVILVSEMAKRNDQLGALIASLPIVTVMVLIWLYLDKQPAEKNKKSCLLHLLVCCSNTPHVSGVSMA